MTDTPVERPSPERTATPERTGSRSEDRAPERPDPPTPHDETPAGRRSPLEDMDRTPGDGTLQDATPAGLSAEELRRRAEETDGTVQPGTG